jgi:hypothetical protein
VRHFRCMDIWFHFFLLLSFYEIHIQKSWVVCSFAHPRWRFLQARNFTKIS